MRPSLLLLLLLVASATALAADIDDRRYDRWLNDKPPIGEIVVNGSEAFSASEITSRMYSRRRTGWSTLKGDRRTRVQRESQGRDTLEIGYLYLTNGYLNVRVEERIEMAPDSTARIVVTIEEGPQFRYGETTVAGDHETRLNWPLLKISQRLKPGKVINLFDIRGAAYDMKGVLANEGYPYAQIRYLVDTAAEVCPVQFEVAADSLVRFGPTAVVGTVNFPDYTARRESKVHEGDVYRRQAIIDTQRRLVESGYFSTVRIAEADSAADRLNPEFVLRVRERKPHYVTFQTGASQSDETDLQWDISSGFGKRNLFGSRKIDLLAQWKFGVGTGQGLLEHLYRIRFTEPWFMGTRMPLALTAQWEPGVDDPDEGYRVRSWSLAASTRKNFGREYKTMLGFEYESVNITGVPEDSLQPWKDERGISVRRKWYGVFRRDSRDHIFVPRRGSLTDLSVERFGGFLGGDDSFTKAEASWSSYQVVWPGWIAASRIKFGWAEAFGETDEVPFDDRFRLGGANSIRGFVVNSLGPTNEAGDPERSSFVAVFNQEFRWQTIQIFQFIPGLRDNLAVWPLWQSVFVDAGNGFRRTDEFDWDDLVVSAGAGFQIVSPAGPIRVDYARHLKARGFDYDSHWHFTILYAF